MFHYDPTFSSLIAFYLSSSMAGILICVWVFIAVATLIKYVPDTKIMIVFDMLYEKVYNFYGDILGPESGKNMKLYIATLFFVIFFANIIGILLDFIAPIFGMNTLGGFLLAEYIVMPTSDMQFNIALSIFSTLLLLYVQFGTLGTKNFIYNYFPIWGKWYIEIERGKMRAIIYYPLSVVAKIGDIIISLFLWFLDFVWLLAKIISLAIIAPLLVYAQGMLVAIIQAMVFPLLVAIFIRMAMMETA